MSDKPFEPTPIRSGEMIDSSFRRLFAEIVEHYNGWLEEQRPKTHTHAHVAAALARLEREQCYGYPEFWEFLAELEATSD